MAEDGVQFSQIGVTTTSFLKCFVVLGIRPIKTCGANPEKILFQNNNNYYYIHLTAFFPGQPGKPAPEKWILDFTGARDDGVAVAPAGPYANHLHLAPDR